MDYFGTIFTAIITFWLGCVFGMLGWKKQYKKGYSDGSWDGMAKYLEKYWEWANKQKQEKEYGMSKSVEEYHKEFDALYGGHEPNLSLSKVELAASEAAYSWQSDKEGHLTLEMFPEVFKRGFLNGYELAEKDLGWHSVEESLPSIDEEVIALADIIAEDSIKIGLGRICFAHIINPDLTVDIDGKPYKVVSHNGWNVPGVKYWMPMPKIPEEK